MKVKELLSQLANVNPELEVVIFNDDTFHEIDDVDWNSIQAELSLGEEVDYSEPSDEE